MKKGIALERKDHQPESTKGNKATKSIYFLLSQDIRTSKQ